MTDDTGEAGPQRQVPPLSFTNALTMALTLGAVVAIIVSSCAQGGSGESDLPPSMRPNEVTPEPAVDLRPVPWARAEPIEDGRRVRLHATLTGGPPCAVLGRVDLRETADAVTATLWVGRRPDADCDGPQRQIGFPIAVTVELGAPLGRRPIRDGAA